MDISSFFQSIGVNNNKVSTNNIQDDKALRDTQRLEQALKSFVDGEVVKGEVVDIKGLVAKIITANGDTLNGQLQNIGQLSIGEERSFIVKNEDGVVKFALVPEDSDTLLDNNLKKALDSQGLKSSDKDIEIAKNLLKSDLPVNKETIMALNRAMSLLGKGDNQIDKALYMLKNEVPLNTKNANMLNEFVNKEVNVLNSSNNILSQVNALKDGEIKDILQKIFELNKNIENTNSKQVDKENIANNSLKDVPKDMIKDVLKDIPKEELNKMATSNLGTTKDSNITRDLEKLIFEKSKMVFSENDKNALNNTDKIIEKLPLKDILKFTPKGDSPKEIDEFLNKTNAKIDEAIKVLENSKDPASQKLLETLLNHKETVTFMQYAKDNIYVQMPLNINGEDTNGELLVFKDKNSKKSKSGGVSAIVGLDTVNLGRYETYIQKLDNKVNLQFRLESEEIIKLTKENLPKLSNLLSKYNLAIDSVAYKTIDSSFSIITDDIENEEKEIVMPSVKFDVKL